MDYNHSNDSFKVQPFSLEIAASANNSQSNGTSTMEGEGQRTQDGKFEEDDDFLSDHLLVVNLPSCFDPAVLWKSKMLCHHLADVTGLKRRSIVIKECKFDCALVKIGKEVGKSEGIFSAPCPYISSELKVSLLECHWHKACNTA